MQAEENSGGKHTIHIFKNIKDYKQEARTVYLKKKRKTKESQKVRMNTSVFSY